MTLREGNVARTSCAKKGLTTFASQASSKRDGGDLQFVVNASESGEGRETSQKIREDARQEHGEFESADVEIRASDESGILKDGVMHGVGGKSVRTISRLGPIARRPSGEHIYYDLVPSCSDRLDPFAQLPVSLDKFQEQLVNFYLVDYPKATYGLSSKLKPHPVATNFSIAMNNPPNFQIALARSALYRLTLQKYTTDTERKELELASRRHRAEAIRMVRSMALGTDANNHKDKLIAAIISLGTLDNRTGAKDTAKMHFAAVRRILKSIGGPTNLRSALLSLVMCHFECLYGTPQASYVWQAKDTGRLLKDLNGFLSKMWNLWTLLDKEAEVDQDVKKEEIAVSGLRDAFSLRPMTGLYDMLKRPLERDPDNIGVKDKMRLIFQLNCLLTLCLIVLDYAVEHELLEIYVRRINASVNAAQLKRMPCNNHMWLIQAHDQSTAHIVRVWEGAGFTFLLKHTPYKLQLPIRDWLLAFLMGEDATGKKALKLEPFDFSYAQ